MKPLISVIVPIYNIESYIEKCIKSIICQTYDNLEILLIDDGSTDSSAEICKKYALQDNRITYVYKYNGGLSDARNQGIELANGEYLSFIDGDDYIHSEMIEKLYVGARYNDADISMCGFIKVDEHGNSMGDNCIEKTILTNVEALNYVIGTETNDKYINCTVAWNKLYRKELFTGIRYPFRRIHEDEFVTYKLLAKSNKVVVIGESLYYYVQRNGSIMKSPFSKKKYDSVEAFRERVEFSKNIEGADVARAVDRYLSSLYRYTLNFKSSGLATKQEIKALRVQYNVELKCYRGYLTKLAYFKRLIRNIFPLSYEIYMNFRTRNKIEKDKQL